MHLRWIIAYGLLALALSRSPERCPTHCQARIDALERRVRELELSGATGHHYSVTNNPQPAGSTPTKLVTGLRLDAAGSLSPSSASGRDVGGARQHAGSSRQMEGYGDLLGQVSKVAARAASFGFVPWLHRPGLRCSACACA